MKHGDDWLVKPSKENLLYIPSAGRAAIQPTLAALPAALLPRVRLVCQEAQFGAYKAANKAGAPLLRLPKAIRTISLTRKWIAEHAQVYSPRGFYIIDDDLRFVRRTGEGTKLRRIEKEELIEMFALLDSWLVGGVGMVGITSRFDNQFIKTSSHRWNGRICQFAGYRTPVAAACKFGRVEFYSDHDVTVQVLRHGYATKVSANWAYEPVIPGQGVGGCSTYRTAKLETESVRQVAKNHEPYSVLIEGHNSKRYPGEPIAKVNFRWKKAYLSGLPEELR